MLDLCCTSPELGRLVWTGPALALMLEVVTPSRQLWEEFCELDGWVGRGKISDWHLKKTVCFF